MITPVFRMIVGWPRSVSPSGRAVDADGFIFLTGKFGRDLEAPDLPLPEGIEA